MKIYKFNGLLLLTFLLLFIAACAIQRADPEKYFNVKEYHKALLLYKDAFVKEKAGQEQAKLAFRIAQCYKYQAEYKSSLQWFKIAYEKGYGFKALEELAFGLKQQEDYQEAIQAFKKLENEVKTKNQYRKEVSICKLAEAWKVENPLFYYNVTNHQDINSEFSDFSGSYDAKGNIYFSSDRIGSTGKEIYAWTGRLHTDLYRWNVVDRTIDNLSILNSKSHEGAPSLAILKKKIYFTHCSKNNTNDAYCQIFESTITNDEIGEPTQLDLFCDECNNMQAAIHKSDSILVFSSDRNKAQGKFDLFISFKVNDEWSEPKSLPDNINSDGNESFPTWYNDTLYFSSDGHVGMGGLDIFKTYSIGNGKWSNPQNLKYPINSGADDFGFVVDPNFYSSEDQRLKGVITSNRNFENKDDLFDFVLLKNDQLKKELPSKFTFKANIQFQFMEFDSKSTVSSNSKSLDSVSINSSSIPVVLNTKAKSSISLELATEQVMKFTFSKTNYLNTSFEIRIELPEKLTTDSVLTIQQVILMTPIEKGKEYLLNNVYYDFDKSDLRDESFASLDYLVNLLKANDRIKLEIRSYTDCRGEEDYNLQLSQRRAQSVVDYLVSQGIDLSRLFSKGNGESQPVTTCICEQCTDDEHQQNRRTTFLII